jgi:hypothetical protein
MLTLIVTLMVTYAVVGFLRYKAGADDRHRRDWQAQQDADQSRHPSTRA